MRKVPKLTGFPRKCLTDLMTEQHASWIDQYDNYTLDVRDEDGQNIHVNTFINEYNDFSGT